MWMEFLGCGPRQSPLQMTTVCKEDFLIGHHSNLEEANGSLNFFKLP